MPLYEYISKCPEDPDNSCRVCSKGFELRRPLDRPALEVCPLCRNAVKKLISRVNSPMVAKPFSVTDAKKAGFTVLEKRDEGVFEKQ
jgi:predicted nucleic acid-binding Zn ribbon protein